MTIVGILLLSSGFLVTILLILLSILVNAPHPRYASRPRSDLKRIKRQIEAPYED